MKRIPVLDGETELYALVDDEDAELLLRFKWRAHRAQRSKTVYARGYVKGKRMLMHRLILGDEAGEAVDHMDGDGLNNQRVNLQSITRALNNTLYHARIVYQRLEHLL